MPGPTDLLAAPRPLVERMEIASDLTYDRTKTFKALVDNTHALIDALKANNGDVGEFTTMLNVGVSVAP